MKKISGWIFIKYDVKPALFNCSKCGANRELHLPASISDVSKQAEAFAESHRFCTEAKERDLKDYLETEAWRAGW